MENSTPVVNTSAAVSLDSLPAWLYRELAPFLFPSEFISLQCVSASIRRHVLLPTYGVFYYHYSSRQNYCSLLQRLKEFTVNLKRLKKLCTTEQSTALLFSIEEPVTDEALLYLSTVRMYSQRAGVKMVESPRSPYDQHGSPQLSRVSFSRPVSVSAVLTGLSLSHLSDMGCFHLGALTQLTQLEIMMAADLTDAGMH